MLKNAQILLILSLLLSTEFFSIIAESQVQVEPFNESLIKNNIVILIDSSGSTANVNINSSSNSFIVSNALSIIRGLRRCTSTGVVIFGVETITTDMLSMSNDTNKKELERFIKDYGKPKKVDTQLDNGLQAAEGLLNSVTGTKEIIVISDGLIPPFGLSQTKNTVIDLKVKDVKIQFIQVIDYSNARLPNHNYELLAKAAGTNVILLYPDERVSIMNPSGNASNANEPCILPTPTITSGPTITINETSIPSTSSIPINQNAETRTEAIKTPGFEGVLIIFTILILIKLRDKI